MDPHWANIFKTLGNPNRLKIIAMLSVGQKLTVTEISKQLNLSVKSTSKHLVLLRHQGILEYVGRHGHVIYAVNHNLPQNIHQVIKIFLHL